jgi:hypothetical protein
LKPGFEIKSRLDPIFMLLWKELPQEQIRRWIERIPRHIQKIIELKGGNGYKEGAFEKPRRLNKAGQVVDSKGNAVDMVEETVIDIEEVKVGEGEGEDQAYWDSALSKVDALVANIEDLDDINSQMWDDCLSSESESE